MMVSASTEGKSEPFGFTSSESTFGRELDITAGTIKKLYKIYQEFSPPNAWIFGDIEEPGIYFYISDIYSTA